MADGSKWNGDTAMAGSLELTKVGPSYGNPFARHAGLRAIWSPALAKIAKMAVDEAWEALGSGEPEAAVGEIFLVLDKGRKPVGITGWCPWDSPDRFGLRWHGLAESQRGSGNSGAIIGLVARRVLDKNPPAREMVEFMPDVPEYAATAAYFEGLGFKAAANSVEVDWSDMRWREFVMALPKAQARPAARVKGAAKARSGP